MYSSLEIPSELLAQYQAELEGTSPHGSPLNAAAGTSVRRPHNSQLASNAIRKRTRTLSGKAKPYKQLDIRIPLDASFESVKVNLWEVARGLISHWSHLKDEDFQVKQYSGGLTNKLFKVTADVCGEQQVILIRVYGDKTGKMLDRESEIVVIQELHRQGMSARFYGTYANGCAYGHVEGRPLSVHDLWGDKEISDKIAMHVGRWHAVVQVPQLDQQPNLWRTINKWISIVPEDYSHLDAEQSAQLRALKIDIKQEAAFLESELMKINSPIYFCHSDLNPGNIILSPDGGSIMLIDHEYACYNYRGFDLGNHFCEYITFDIDLSKYPARATQLAFLRTYLRTYYHHYNNTTTTTGESEVEVSEEEVEVVYREANKYALASHLFWGVWGLAQSGQVSIEFDYFTYGYRRLAAYLHLRDTFLAL
eukprot:TRINITY_DN1284_c0_g1_i1.p1 TRINITY_DN1284_c0_g1~~TRINITY_DN1284_c0_g1_i1.p1  ORF type:complete len:422 (+),score=60.17 TRINITY_DN1284_c0_g1_i1:111-1376(+)